MFQSALSFTRTEQQHCTISQSHEAQSKPTLLGIYRNRKTVQLYNWNLKLFQITDLTIFLKLFLKKI